MKGRIRDELLCLAAIALLLGLPVVMVFWQAAHPSCGGC